MSGHGGGVGRSETKEETTDNRLRAKDVGTLTTLGTFSSTNRKKDEDDKPGSVRTLSGSRSGRAALRREQLESNHRGTEPRERKVRPITDVTSTGLRKEEMAVLRREQCGV
jgi:hypothetical protein